MSFEPLKYIYEKPFSHHFGIALKKIAPKLDLNTFEKEIYTEIWDNLELKDRMRHLTKILAKYLSQDFETASQEIIELIKHLNPEDYKYPALVFMFLPDYIETFGLAHFDVSMKSFEHITEFSTCEFAVRPFIVQNQKKALDILLSWTKHKNHHIRRLASEGCRPKLPWAMALKELQTDPSPIFPILDNLKNDPEDYVYRSVANNLNDISKDHPNMVLDIAKKWKNQSKNTDWLIKHASRTLLKAGNQDAMQLFGYGAPGNATIQTFSLANENIKIGEYLEFDFLIRNKKKAINRLEYAVYFLKQNDNHTKKVFKISEKKYESNSEILISKRHNFKPISTRKYYLGIHKIAIIINGIESNTLNFRLK